MKFAPRAALVVALLGALALGPGLFTSPASAADPTAVPVAEPPAPLTPTERQGIETARDLGTAFAAVAKRAGPSVVYLHVEKTSAGPAALDGQDLDLGELFGPGFERRFGRALPRGSGPRGKGTPRAAPRQQGQGSGFVVSSDGLILTNAHVVDGAQRVTARLTDGREFVATVLGADKASDVALLRVDAKDLPALRLANSDGVGVGEWVVAIGNPFGLQTTVTAGIVSATGRCQVGIADFEDFIQTDAAINPGNSGGPLLDLGGDVVGMNSAIFSRTGGSVGIGFAIPSNLVADVKEQLLVGGKVTRGFLGVSIQDMTPDLATSFGAAGSPTRGALVSDVTAASPAAKAGVRAGDVVVAVDGRPVANSGELRNRIAMVRPGRAVRLTVARDGGRRELEATLATREATTDAGDEAPAADPGFGLKLQPAGEDGAPASEGDGAAVVAEVVPGSPADRAGLEPGMAVVSVDRHTVKTLAEAEAALAKAETAGRALLLVRDEHGARFVVLRK